jgi:chaperone modulatory protein CbpM
MMISRQEFSIRAQLEHRTLDAWIEEDWLIPSEVGDQMMFSDADLARARLIRDLKDDLGVNDEGVGIILNLIDQIHSSRRMLTELLRSLHSDG